MFHAMIGGRTIFLLLFHSDTRSAPSMSRHLELHPTHMVFGREAKTILSRMGADQAELKLPWQLFILQSQQLSQQKEKKAVLQRK